MASVLALQPSPAVPLTIALQVPIPLVLCQNGNSLSAGTAFRIGPHLLLSVKHVTNIKNCAIDGEPIHVIYTSSKADFSMLSDDRIGGFLKVDCGGFVAGHRYVAVGHARAMDELTVVPMIATGKYEDGLSVLVGVFEVQPGQSGGAVIDLDTMKVVGTINAADWEEGLSFSTELSGTPVCGGERA
jgi:hypothetical protein